MATLLALAAALGIAALWALERRQEEGYLSGPGHRTHFLTFADGILCYREHARRLATQAATVGGFDVARVLDMGYVDPEFRRRNAALLAERQGNGYWTWKPAIVFRYALEEAVDGELVVYCDSLYRFQSRRDGSFARWISDAVQRAPCGVVLFRMKPEPNRWEYPEREWTKADTYVVVGAEGQAVRDSTQAWGGFIALRRTTPAMTFLAAWLTYCQDARAVSNAPSGLATDPPELREHRHDQSVVSLLAKKWGVPLLEFPREYMIDLRHAGEGSC